MNGTGPPPPGLQRSRQRFGAQRAVATGPAAVSGAERGKVRNGVHGDVAGK